MTEAPAEEFPRRQYENPPIVEVLARLDFASPMEWNVSTPGLIYARLRETYPAEPEFRTLMEAQLGPDPASPSRADFQFRTGPQMVMFSDKAKSRLLMVGPGQISAHALPPYEGWESLESRLFEALEILADMVPDPKIPRIGVRYINRIVLPQVELDLSEYLAIGIQLPRGLPLPLVGFLNRFESAYDDGRSRISITWASTDAEPETAAFILDLDLNWQGTEVLGIDEARGELGQLKGKETVAFESLLKDQLREVFGERG